MFILSMVLERNNLLLAGLKANLIFIKAMDYYTF